jgi:hypothetical protein
MSALQNKRSGSGAHVHHELRVASKPFFFIFVCGTYDEELHREAHRRDSGDHDYVMQAHPEP